MAKLSKEDTEKLHSAIFHQQLDGDDNPQFIIAAIEAAGFVVIKSRLSDAEEQRPSKDTP